VALKRPDLATVHFPELNDAIVSGACKLGPARVALDATGELAYGADNRVGGKRTAGLNFAVGVDLADVEDANIGVGAARNHRVLVVGQSSPDALYLALVHELGRDLPLLRVPNESLPVPATRHNIGAAGGNIQSADIMAVAYEETIGVIGCG
jgi:hypothetical protein